MSAADTPRFETLFDVLWTLRRVDDDLDANARELDRLRSARTGLEAERARLAAIALPVMAPAPGGLRAMSVDRDCVYLVRDDPRGIRPELVRLRPESPLCLALLDPPPAYCPNYDPESGDLCACGGCQALIEAEADRHASAAAEDRAC